MTTQHNLLTSWKNDQTSRHNSVKTSLLSDYYDDLSSMHVDLSDLNVETRQIIYLLSAWQLLDRNMFLPLIFLTNE